MRCFALLAALLAVMGATVFSVESQSAPLSAGAYFFARASQSAGAAPGTSAGRSVQYLTLYSRASVFAMYCDLDGVHGWNVAVRALGLRTQAAWAEVERALGGAHAAESRFERMRNDESARISGVDADRTCDAGANALVQIAGLSADAFQVQAQRVPLR